MKPLLASLQARAHGRPAFPRHATPTAPAPTASGQPDSAPCAGAPRVETVVTDGRVTRIIVTCTCGERLELDCTY